MWNRLLWILSLPPSLRRLPLTLRSRSLERGLLFHHRCLVFIGILLQTALRWFLLCQVRPSLPRFGRLRVVVLLERRWWSRLICRSLGTLVICEWYASARASCPVVVVYHRPDSPSAMRPVASVVGEVAFYQSVVDHLSWALPPVAHFLPVLKIVILYTQTTPRLLGIPLSRALCPLQVELRPSFFALTLSWDHPSPRLTTHCLL